MPRTKKQPVTAIDAATIVADPKEEENVSQPPPVLDLSPAVPEPPEEEGDAALDDEEGYEEDDEGSYDDTFDDANVPVLKALFDLLTNEEGTNVAQILTNLAQSIDKTNKILFKLLNVLSSSK